MVNDELQLINDLRGYPRYLKNKTPVYPVKMENALEFYQYVAILNIPKNHHTEIEILQMSYLKYLLFLSQLQGSEFMLHHLTRLLQIVLKAESIDFQIDEKEKITILVDDKFKITEYLFDKLKTIIAEQNMVDLDDDNINPELKKKLKEAEEFMSKRAGQKVAPFSQQLLAYEYETGKSLNEILNMTISHFKNSIEVISHIKFADILQQAKYAGFKEFKDDSKLPTWLSAIEKSKSNPLLMDAEKLKNDMGSTFNA